MKKSLKKYLYLYFMGIALIFCLISGHSLKGDFYWDEAVYADIAQHLFYSEFYPRLQDDLSKFLGDFSSVLFNENDPRGNTVFTRHPPLYMMSISALSHLPFQEEVVYRWFSILVSLFGLFLLFHLLVKEDKPWLAVLSSFLLIFNTLFQQYSQSATMYALFFFFNVLLFYAYAENKIVWQGIASLGCVYTHYLGFLTLLLIFILEIVEFKGKFWKKRLAYYLLLVLGYLPWIYYAIPGLIYQHGKYGSMAPQISLYNILMTFGVSGFLLLGIYWYNVIRHKNLKENLNQSPLSRFILLSMLTMFVYGLFFLLIKPFLRYLYCFQAIWLVALILIAANYSKIFLQNFGKKQQQIVFALLVIFLFVPNVKSLGVFPYMTSYHDLHDSIYHQEWQQAALELNKQSVTVENMQSYYYYFRELYPEIPRQKFPWHNLGIYKLKYDQYFPERTLPALSQIKTKFVVMQIGGKGKPQMIENLNELGYQEYKKLKYTIILEKK